MAFFPGLLGTISNTINILISTRKCYKAFHEIEGLFSDNLKEFKYIKGLLPYLTQVVLAEILDDEDFRNTIAEISSIESDFANVDAKIQRKKHRITNGIHQIYLHCSAPETVAALTSVRNRLTSVKKELRDRKINCRTNLKENQELEAGIIKMFETHLSFSSTNRLVSGDTQGICCLLMGKILFEGLVVEPDYQRSAPYFRSAAIKYKIKEAFSYLGEQHERGLGMRKDPIEAMNLYRFGANLEDPKSLHAVARCYQHGIGVEKDDGMRFRFYKKAVDARHAKSFRGLGYYYYTQKNFKKAVECYKRGAEAGDEDALASLAFCLLFGTGIAKNEKCAVDLLEMATDFGCRYAYSQLADCYVKGRGVEESKETALNLYAKAAEAHVHEYQGECLVFDSKYALDIGNTFEDVRRDADAHNPLAMCALAGMYRAGTGIEKNASYALKLYLLLEANGTRVANNVIGEMYKNGEGTDKNIREAIVRFEKEAEYNNENAHENLALIYKNEPSFLNEYKALYHHRCAADLGHPQARETVSMYFVRGTSAKKISFTLAEQQCLQELNSQGKKEGDHNLTPQRNNNISFVTHFDTCPENTLDLMENTYESTTLSDSYSFKQCLHVVGSRLNKRLAHRNQG